ncbi:MAG: cysteine desulfurase family protein [Thermoanaerobaculia bacterium]
MPIPVYFDHNATTPLDPRVRDAMLPWLGASWGNPSSIHRFGQAAREAVEEARERVARLLGADPPEIVFAASGTEANNAVIADILARHPEGGRIVASAVEHPSILGALERWAVPRGFEIVRVAPGADGVVAVDELAAALTADTRLAALMLANNELGTIQPVSAVGALCRARGIPLLCDAVQAAGKIAIDVERLGADFVVVAGHKFHGPLGAAALWIRGGVPFEAYLVGGSQERRRRASTVNVPAVVGFGAACDQARRELGERAAHLAALRDRFESGVAAIAGARLHSTSAPRLPNVAHVAFPGLVGQDLMIRLDLAGFAVSTGAACASGTVEPSGVLLATGMPRAEALASIRVSFGLPNRAAEVERFLPVLVAEVAALRDAALEAAGAGR